MTCTCGELHVNARRKSAAPINAALRRDPSRTAPISNRFEKALLKKFADLKRAIFDVVVRQDMFGLTHRQRYLGVLEEGVKTNLITDFSPTFVFKSDAWKMMGFSEWLQDMLDQDLLRAEERPSMYGSVLHGQGRWTDAYIQSSYQQGILRARQELRKKGYAVPPVTGFTPTGASPIAVAFNQPFHIERVATLYMRTFRELKGITDDMDKNMSRVLAQAFAEGRNPREIARILADQVDGIGLRRAKTLARTEIISAHHQANVTEYEQWGALGVSVEVEWLTAGYKVCPICRGLSGKVFTTEKIRGMIPAHPNCRCVAVPITKDAPLAPLPPPEPEWKEYTPDELDVMFKNGDSILSEEAKAKKRNIMNVLFNDVKDDPIFKQFAVNRINAANGNHFNLDTIPDDIYNEGGPKVVRGFIQQWAITSANQNPDSLLIQIAASEEFKLGDTCLDVLKDRTNLSNLRRERSSEIPGLRRLLRAMYNDTQKILKEKHIKQILLYRGMGRYHIHSDALEEALRNGHGKWTLQPMSSFASRRSSSTYFGNWEVSNEIPANRIISTTETGFGCSGECEFVVLGNPAGDEWDMRIH